MSREAHVRFCESLAGQFRRATRPVAESFFATLKVEFIHESLFRTRSQATTEIFEYIEAFYNRVRTHSFVGYVSPQEFESDYVRLHSAA